MRLRELEFLIKEAKDLLAGYSSHFNQTVTPTRGVLDNLNMVRNAISIIEQTGLFKSDINLLNQTTVRRTGLNDIEVKVEEKNQIDDIIHRLYKDISIIIESLHVALPPSNNDTLSIYIKLPELSNFEDLTYISNQLKLAIQLPLTTGEISDEVKIKNFDSGSNWIEISLQTVQGVAFIGALARSAAYLHKTYLKCKEAELHYKNLELETEHNEAIVKANKQLLENVVQKEAEFISKEFTRSEQIEDINRLKHSIKSLAELIEKGAEVRPALEAPKEVSNKFPDYKNLNAAESIQKFIEGGSKE